MIHYRRSERLVEAWLACQELADLSVCYPGFHDWFVNTVIPGVVLRGDPFLVAEDAGQVVGFAIGKRGPVPKLRCIRVAEAYRNRGIGLHLIDRSLRALDVVAPEVTVAEEMMAQWARIFVNRYDFHLNHVAKGLYRPGKVEYCFNQRIPGDVTQTLL